MGRPPSRAKRASAGRSPTNATYCARSRIDKLEIYRGLRVPEVWVWRSLAPEIHVLQESGYVAGARSLLLPDLDVQVLASFSARADQVRAVKEYRARVRAAVRH